MLTADDLGGGQWQAGQWEPEWSEGPDRWRWEGACPGYRGGDYPSLAQRTDQRTITWTDGPFDVADVPRWVHEIVDLFESGDAAPRLSYDPEFGHADPAYLQNLALRAPIHLPILHLYTL